MPWRRGTELKPSGAKLPLFFQSLQIQSLNPVDPSAPEKGFRIRALAASDSVNTGRIRIRSSAWKIRKQGAPMLFEHGKDPRIGASPIGRWDKFTATEGVGLVAEGLVQHFKPEDPRSRVVEDVRSGLLTDVSVGHLPERMEIAKQGAADSFLDVHATTLGEISVVTVGMDGESTMELMAASALGFEWTDSERAGDPPAEPETKTQKTGGRKMDLKLMIQALNLAGAGLKEDANEAEVMGALSRMTQSAVLGSRAGEVLSAIGLTTQSSSADIKAKLAAIMAPENFVSKAEHEKLLKVQTATAIQNLIATHPQIPEKSKAYAQQLLEMGHEPESQGRKLFDMWVQSLPSIGTRQITGAGSGTAPKKGGESQEAEMEEITPEDVSWCQNLGYFRDQRDPKTGVITQKGVDLMAQMAEISSREALELLFDQAIPETALDKALREQRA